MIELVFGWPPRELSPNARVHWATKAKAAKKYKQDCGWICKAIRFRPRKEHTADLVIQFCPPDNRRRDVDNMLSSCKALFDAVSESLGIDDSEFTYEISKAEPVKNGAVKVVIT